MPGLKPIHVGEADCNSESFAWQRLHFFLTFITTIHLFIRWDRVRQALFVLVCWLMVLLTDNIRGTVWWMVHLHNSIISRNAAIYTQCTWLQRILVMTATNRNGQNRNGHKPKRPLTGTATNRNAHKPKRPQIEIDTTISDSAGYKFVCSIEVFN